MAPHLDMLRAAADRVAASHGLEVVDLEFSGGGGKHRTLRVFLEKNPAGRERLRAALARLAAEHADDDPEGELDENRAESQPADEPEAEWSRAWLEALPSVARLEHLSGVTHEDCEVFSRDFGTLLDVEDLVPGAAEYTLEVSSPGLDRRLSTEADFRRFDGCLVKLETDGDPEGRRKWQGRITDVEGEELLLTVDEKPEKAKGKPKGKAEAGPGRAAEPVRIPLHSIRKAHLVPEF